MTTLTLNQELNGIEVKFDAKPLQATLDGLKKLGFRWHRQKKIWYAKNTPERLEMAQAIADGEEYAEQIRKEEPKEKKQKAEKKNANATEAISRKMITDKQPFPDFFPFPPPVDMLANVPPGPLKYFPNRTLITDSSLNVSENRKYVRFFLLHYTSRSVILNTRNFERAFVFLQLGGRYGLQTKDYRAYKQNQ